MSLYNMLCGQNHLAPLVLESLNISRTYPESEEDYQGDGPWFCGRYRDAYFAVQDDEPRLAVYTRNGGGNRECYCEEESCEPGCLNRVNARLAEHPLYVEDQDDNFDCTYATFFFRVPEPLLPLARELMHETKTPQEKFQHILDQLQKPSEEMDESGKRAVEVGKKILGPIMEHFKKDTDAVPSQTD